MYYKENPNPKERSSPMPAISMRCKRCLSLKDIRKGLDDKTHRRFAGAGYQTMFALIGRDNSGGDDEEQLSVIFGKFCIGCEY
jgi:hypothetical protein